MNLCCRVIIIFWSLATVTFYFCRPTTIAAVVGTVTTHRVTQIDPSVGGEAKLGIMLAYQIMR